MASVSDQVLTILKLCLLALLYLFFLRVLYAVWTELRVPSAAGVPGTGMPATGGARRSSAPLLVVVEPTSQAGLRYELDEELTIGRAGGCRVRLEDQHASQLHARVFERAGQFLLEDLGSTNGTFHNGAPVAGPQVLAKGDLVRVGGTVLEFTP